MKSTGRNPFQVFRDQWAIMSLYERFEQVILLARHDHADVDEFRALHARHDADHRVVIDRVRGHESPPRRMRAALRGGA